MSTPILSANTAFVRFARHLRGIRPQVPISIGLDAQITHFIDRVHRSRQLDDDQVGWDSLVCNMAIGAEALVAGDHLVPRCGLPLLRVFGHLGEVLSETETVSLPAPIAIAFMMEFQTLPLLLDWTDRNTRIVTTETGIAQLGGHASFPVPAAPHHAFELEFFRWHLERLAEQQGRSGFADD